MALVPKSPFIGISTSTRFYIQVFSTVSPLCSQESSLTHHTHAYANTTHTHTHTHHTHIVTKQKYTLEWLPRLSTEDQQIKHIVSKSPKV